ncbi:MAG: PD-(D/E)XK nuclease family protein [Anaerolineaceae bacterium]|nr:PD-(D/E)XK nuclease family protein [Anaerolineaceae bacterium]
MSLPANFQFSQSNLHDYIDCARRFELRSLLQMQWPAPRSEPILEQEHHILMGERFHHLLHQYFIGIPKELLAPSREEEQLNAWWENFNRSGLLDSIPKRVLPEKTLAASWEGQRLIAKIDLLAFIPGEHFVILDWKTSINRPPSRFLTDHIQSRFYPFVLVLAGRSLNNRKAVLPEQIEMIYWFANFPDQIERIRYSQEKYTRDEEFFSNLMHEISRLPAGQFLATADERKCRYCNFRSFCERGETAGNWREMEAESLGVDDLESFQSIQFDQIAEITF